MNETTAEKTHLHTDDFLVISWHERGRVAGIEWQEATASMSDDDFKTALELFASYVERKKARGILVDVTHFRHKVNPALQERRVKNISTRYSAAGVHRFRLPIPPWIANPTDDESIVAWRVGCDADIH